MNKAYNRIVWENYPSTKTALNENNLNHIDVALDEVDNRVVEQDTTKANQSDLLSCLSNVTYNEQTGLFTFTWKNGNTKEIDLNVEKIPVDFSMSADGIITMKTSDGSTFTADVASLIKSYSFTNTSEFTWTVTTDASGNKSVKASLVDGGINESKLQPNFLADARAAKTGAETAKNASELSALEAEGYAVGKQNGVDVLPDSQYYHNNAKYYSDKAGATSLGGLSDVNISAPQNGDQLLYNSQDGIWHNGSTGAYKKPSSGIPKTDLASAVQTSLGKADSAIQSSDLANASVLQATKWNGYSIWVGAKATYDSISHDANTLYIFTS